MSSRQRVANVELAPDESTALATVDDVRPGSSDAVLVDVAIRALRNWIEASAARLQEATDGEGWSYLGFHDLRRLWATQLRGADVDAMVVCDWGGWDDLETVLEHYRGTGRPRPKHSAASARKSTGSAIHRVTPTTLEYIVCSMSTSIRISEETKQKLEAVKRDDETFDELLDRIVITRTEEDVREWAGGGGEGLEESMKKARENLNESLEKRSNQ